MEAARPVGGPHAAVVSFTPGMPFLPAHRGGAGAPMVLLHGFTDTWRTWELVLPALEARHDVLAPTLAGHAGGPPLPDPVDRRRIADAVERAMDEAGFATAHVAGNSLGGYVALQLAARGRAETVVALAPAGGWAAGDEAFRATLHHFTTHAGAARRRDAARRDDRLHAGGPAPGDRALHGALGAPLARPIAHFMRGAAACPGVFPLIEHAREAGWPLDAAAIRCPVRVVWGTDDRLLAWPRTAARYRTEVLPHADWVELDGVGHSPQLDVPLETAQLILGFTDP